MSPWIMRPSRWSSRARDPRPLRRSEQDGGRGDEPERGGGDRRLVHGREASEHRREDHDGVRGEGDEEGDREGARGR